jgi:hypothetical protein
MAAIAAAAASAAIGLVTIAKTVLGASDTLTYNPGQLQTLVIENDTASPVTILIDGDGVTTFVPGGIGDSIDLAAGFTFLVAAGQTRAVALKNIQRFLVGTVTLTGGAGAKAYIIS